MKYRSENGQDPCINILQCIATDDPGGAETVVRDLTALFSGNGFSTRVTVGGGGWLSEQLGKLTADFETYPYKPFLDLRYMAHIAGLIRKHRIDVLHCHMSQMNLLGSMIGRIVGVPVIATIHGMTNDFDTARQARFYRWAERVNCTLVFVSNALLSRYAMAVGKRKGKGRRLTIYNGIDMAAYGGNKKRIRPSGSFRIAMVGSLLAVKDYRTMIEACRILKERRNTFEVQIAGSGPEEDHLKQLIVDNGLRTEISILGFRDDIPEILNQSDLYVLSSTHEGFSISTVEAMAAGLPVVATRSGGPEEIVVQDETGFLVPIGNPVALADFMQYVMNHTEEALKMGDEGRARVARLFSHETMRLSYLRLYEGVTKGHYPRA